MIITTERLTIRFVYESDWRAIRNIMTDFSVSEYAQYDRANDLSDFAVHSRISKWASAADGNDHIFFAVCLKDMVIGYITFNIREVGYETGYCFHSAYHGKGYAKESFTALLGYMKALGAAQIYAGTAIKNLPSVRLLKSVGFELYETEKVSFYKDENGNNIFFDGGIFKLKF